jgi:hypothetical protein
LGLIYAFMRHIEIIWSLQFIWFIRKNFSVMSDILVIHCNQVTVPALASVYNEKALKSQLDTSIYLQV